MSIKNPAAAAAEEIAAEYHRYGPGAMTNNVAAEIIRRHYADQEAMLRRAVAIIESLCHAACMSGSPIDYAQSSACKRILKDAERLGITGDAK